MPKKVLCQMPPGLIEQIDFVAQVEHRNRSDLIREACRRYIREFNRANSPQVQATVAQTPNEAVRIKSMAVISDVKELVHS